MDTHLIAYLWDDAPAALRERIPPSPRPRQMLLCVPARWGARAALAGLPEALASLVLGYSPDYWGHIERFHQPDGTLLIVGYGTFPIEPYT